MTPYDLYYQYRNLSVMFADFKTVYGIDVHEYRNAKKKFFETDFSTESGLEAYEALRKKVTEYGQPAGYKRYLINYPIISEKDFKRTPYVPVWQEYVTMFPDIYGVFLGKGSPDQIKQTLRLAVAFGLVADRQPDLQRYCDKNIGLDCSGFAKTYFNGNFTEIEKFAAQNRLTDLKDVRTGTAIVWKSHQHIALVDRINKVERTGNTVYAVDCMVAESAGEQMLTDGPADGLNYTEYSLIQRKAGDSFSAFRSTLTFSAGYQDAKVYLINQ